MHGWILCVELCGLFAEVIHNLPTPLSLPLLLLLSIARGTPILPSLCHGLFLSVWEWGFKQWAESVPLSDSMAGASFFSFFSPHNSHLLPLIAFFWLEVCWSFYSRAFIAQDVLSFTVDVWSNVFSFCSRLCCEPAQGAFTFRGSMIDMPSVKQAQNIVTLSVVVPDK